MMVALAGFLGSMAFFRLVQRDKADRVIEGRALLLGYLAALAGGYVFEGIRAIPEAIARGSVSPIFHVGRAAYGGLIAGILEIRDREPVLLVVDQGDAVFRSLG